MHIIRLLFLSAALASAVRAQTVIDDSFGAQGTAGAGFVQIANQSSAPGTPTASSRIYFDSSNRLSWKGTNGFVRTFDGTANDADRIYTLPNVAGTVALSSGALTSGRVPFATTGGVLIDDADMTFATDTLTVTKGAFGGMTFISNAIAAANSVTAATNTALTLATLDNNKNVKVVPHGSGSLELTSASGAGGITFTGSSAKINVDTAIQIFDNTGTEAIWFISSQVYPRTSNLWALGTSGNRFKSAGIGPSGVSIGGSSTPIATAGSVNSAHKISKYITAIADAVATPTITVTIPNAAHAGTVRVTLSGSCGAGGAIGANEATGCASYDFAIARTAGVNAVTTISTVYGLGVASVAGGATITVTGAASAISGAVGAANTFTVNVTISRLTGSATNHTCFVTAEILNSNVSGITIQ